MARGRLMGLPLVVPRAHPCGITVSSRRRIVC